MGSNDFKRRNKAKKKQSSQNRSTVSPNEKHDVVASKSLMKKRHISGFVIIAAIVMLYVNGDLLSGYTEFHSMGAFGMQMSMTGFCLSGGYKLVDAKISEDDKDLEGGEDSYEKQSIYSLLYGAYRYTGVVKDTFGRPYQFTFNTWGISGIDDKPYGPEFAQRPGMTAYHSLATMSAVVEYVKKKPDAHFLEIGCGTGAGADLISRTIHPTIRYTALDMQKAAIETCIQRHAAHDNPHLSCVHGNGKTLPIEDKSVDVIIVSETHIAAVDIGAEEKAIFAEMRRVLVPGGIFVWGNALYTHVWKDGADYLQANGFSECGIFNHTARAIEARDQDYDRVELYVRQLLDMYPVFNLPIVGAPCRGVVNDLVKNFYRHPGTHLYNTMVDGTDSYMNMCHKLDMDGCSAKTASGDGSEVTSCNM